MEVVNMEEFKRESKRRAFKDKINAKIQNGKEWIVRNKEAVITLTPVIIGGVTTVSKVVDKRINLRTKNGLRLISVRKMVKDFQTF